MLDSFKEPSAGFSSLRKRFFPLNKDDVSEWTPTGRHNRRVKNLILFGAFTCVCLGVAWSIYNTLAGGPLLAVFSGLTALAGFISGSLAWRNHLRSAAIIMVHLLLMTVTLATLGDVPTGDIPRTNHMNLLPVVAACLLIFNREGWYLRVILPAAGLVAFLALALNLIPLPSTDLLMPAENRNVGVWANNITGIIGSWIVVMLMRSSMNARRALESAMRQGIARGEYQLHYQPQVDAEGRIFGVEALLRWRHPSRGNISPQEFIPLAEETGLIIPIGEWVLRTACAQLATWGCSPQTAHLTIAVNVSASQFRQPDFVQLVERIVSLSGIDPSRLELELTESALADDIDSAVLKMQALKEIGIKWSLDDFGTGYSSLSSLKRFPLDQLKIDQSFVRDLLTDERNLPIVDTIIQLSQNLNLAVIAEGVETEAHLNVLRDAGCPSYQGYLFSPPLPAAALDELINAWTARGQSDHGTCRDVA